MIIWPCLLRGGGGLMLGLALPFGNVAPAAEPAVSAKDLPRVAPRTVEEAQRTFQIKPGFRLETVAAEPLVTDPVALAFDENGRLFVIEMRDYPERREERLGRIRLLEDTNGDGQFDRGTLFVEHLPWPTAVVCYDGGVFVGVTPDILFLKDTNGDGVADERRVVYTGFGAGADRLNMQALMNSFHWGLDNRIHGASGPMGGSITSPQAPAMKPVTLRGKDFSFDPRRPQDFRPESGGGQHGMSFSDDGRKFVCHNSDHIRLVMYEDRYAGRNLHYSLPSATVSIAEDGPAAEVFRLSPEEPWRVIRTAWRVAGLVSGPIEGGGRASGYFTSATGITIYRGNALPGECAGDAFIADVGSNLIHRKKLHPDGVALTARRLADEQKAEFIASSDLWFRPVQFANAPDGALYVADMYREVVEHPWSLPESIKQHLDLYSGMDRGRIHRIVPDGFRQPKLPRLGQAGTVQLVATLEHANGWHRDTAARLLYQRQDNAAVRPLTELLRTSRQPLGRLHALYALDGLGSLTPTLVQAALADADERVRVHAVRLSERFASAAPDSLVQRLVGLAGDSSPRVRYQLAFTLGELRHRARLGALGEIARRDGENSWTQAAVLSSLTEGAGELFGVLATNAVHGATAGGRAFLQQLALLIGARHDSNELAQAVAFAQATKEPALGLACLRSLAEGLQRARLAPERLGNPWTDALRRARQLARDVASQESARLEAIQLLGWGRFESEQSELLPLLEPAQSQAVQLAALRSLGRFADRRVGAELTARWVSLTPRLRQEALSVLLARPERAAALLQAVEAGTIHAADLSLPQIQFLREHRDAKVREPAARLLKAATASPREEVVKAFAPALALPGNAARGRTLYLERCASCHRSGNDGHLLGPDLITVKTSGKEKLLANILDPNREVRPDFVSYLVETRDGESLTGLLVNETATSVTLREAFGRETVLPRADAVRIQSQRQSLMPEGLEAGLDAQALADLLAYIAGAEAVNR